MSEIEIRDLASFGRDFATEFMMSGALDGFDEDERQRHMNNRLVEIDTFAEGCNFLNTNYLVQSSLALSIPVHIDADEPSVGYVRFGDGIQFKGELVTHSTVKIGRIIGGNAVRAFCLTFNNVLLLPYFDEIPEDHLMHVPAFAINDIDRLQAAG